VKYLFGHLSLSAGQSAWRKRSIYGKRLIKSNRLIKALLLHANIFLSNAGSYISGEG
jgi:hypothetical protein